MFREIYLDAHLFYLIELCFDPVNVAFLILKDAFEHFTRTIIAYFHCQLNRLVVGFDCSILGFPIVSMMRLDILANVYLI